MPAQLDRNVQTGQAAVFSVREAMWHREGVVLAEAPNLDEAHRIAGNGFEVKTLPISVRMRTIAPDGGDLHYAVPPANAVAICRMDRVGEDGFVLGTATDEYAPVQFRDVTRVLEPLLDSGLATLTTGGSLREGRDVWMQVQFNIDDPVVREVYGKLGVVPFGTVMNNNSGQRKARLMDSDVRIVCANTFRLALSRASKDLTIEVVHREGAKLKLVEAAQHLWHGVIARKRAAAEHYQLLADATLSVEAFTRSVLDVAAPMPERPKGTTPSMLKGFARASDFALDRRNELTRLWVEGDGHVGNHSAWEALNGAVQALDHDEKLWKVGGSRLSALVYGKLAETKDAVCSAVLAEVTGR